MTPKSPNASVHQTSLRWTHRRLRLRSRPHPTMEDVSKRPNSPFSKKTILDQPTNTLSLQDSRETNHHRPHHRKRRRLGPAPQDAILRLRLRLIQLHKLRPQHLPLPHPPLKNRPPDKPLRQRLGHNLVRQLRRLRAELASLSRRHGASY